MEEIHPELCLQLVDREGDTTHGGICSIEAVLDQEADAVVGRALLQHEGHPVVLRHDDDATNLLALDLIITDRPALGDVEDVTELGVTTPCLDLLLELHPEFLVELAELWAHVRVVEGLSIGLGAEEAVRGGDHVTTVVSAPTEEVLRRESLRYIGIPLPGIATLDRLS